MTDQMLIQADPLRRFCVAAFERTGVDTADALTVADSLVEADLRGVHSHGVWWMVTYTARLRHGGLNPRPQMRVVQETAALAQIDADGAMGQVASVMAMRQAIEKARTSGVGVATVRNSNHNGAAAYYANLAAQAGQIGFASSDAEPTMAPWGGTRPVVGNNPMAYAIPVSSDFAIILDMAQSVVAWGKIALAARRDEKIPATWALDEMGRPTDDPHAAMAGVLMPVGGYKGYGLATVLTVLCSVLPGAAFGLGIPPMTDETARQDNGHFFMALDIATFAPIADFQRRVEQMIAEHRAVPLAEGVERIYLPGEIEHIKRQERLRTGIPLERYTIDALTTLGQELGVDTSCFE